MDSKDGALDLLTRGAAAAPSSSPSASPRTPSARAGATPAKRSDAHARRKPGGRSPRARSSPSGGGGGGGGGGGEGSAEKRRRFAEFWPRDAVDAGIASGDLLTGKVRINPHRRAEAFVSVEGVPHDVKLDGFDAQNRVIDGDVVAFAFDPVEEWRGLEEKTPTPRRAGRRGKPSGGRRAAADVAGDLAALDLAPAGVEDDGGGEVGHARGERAEVERAEGSEDEDEDVYEDESFAADEGASSAFSSASSAPLAALAAAARSGGPGGTPLRPAGRVVAVTDASPRRAAVVGYLDFADPDAAPSARVPPGQIPALRLHPTDPRLPLMSVEMSPGKLPPDVAELAGGGAKTAKELRARLFCARVTRWSVDHVWPHCAVTRSFGLAGSLETETAALVAEHGVAGADDFSPEALACLPNGEAEVVNEVGGEGSEGGRSRGSSCWVIPESERSKRRDFTRVRVATIDPPSARDLDDALHAEVRESDGNLLVGVHIADVSHFVPGGSALDAEARERGTSTYLVNKVMPMLPRLLCENLCSLNPGVERLTFSVEWVMTPGGEILSEWIGRGVIRSCAKLDYATAQRVIEARDAGRSGAEELVAAARDGRERGGPVRVDDDGGGAGAWNPDAVAETIGRLAIAARAMRARRFASGALRLDQTKVVFDLDEAGMPSGAVAYATREANHLVEEFMLCANRAAAKFIADAYPTRALLRNHPEPNERKMAELERFAKARGIAIDATSSAALHASLQALKAESPDAYEVAQLLATLPMQLAKYFCTGSVDEDKWGHYALATPRYTHFTSPIRRYPDVLVHRLVACALEARSLGAAEARGKGAAELLAAIADAARVPETDALHAVAEHCNERKLAAKAVQEGSTHAYLCAFLRRRPTAVSGVVRAVGKKYLCAYVPAFGMEVRVPLEGQRHLAVTQEDDRESGAALSVTVAFDPGARDVSSAAIETATSATVTRAARKKAARDTRGVRGRFLNATEAEAEAAEAILAERRHGRGARTGAGAGAGARGDEEEDPDPLGCGTAPIALPVTIRPVDRVCLLLGAKFPERKKPEVTALLVAHNPLFSAGG